MLSLILFLPALLVGDPRSTSSQPAPASLVPLPIERAVELARAWSPMRRAALAQVEGARTALRFAGRLANPFVEVRAENWTAGNWGWTPSPDPAAPPGVDFFALVSQPIEFSGKRGARRGVASAEKDAAEAGARQADLWVVTETVRLYLQALRARGLIEALEANRDGLTTLVTAMAARVKEGYAPEADLTKFQTEVARVETQLARTRLELDRALTLLASLLGEPSPIAAERLVEPRPAAVPEGDPFTLAQSALGQLPELGAARARLARAQQVLALERARRVPDAIFSGGYKRTTGVNTAVAAVSVAVPLFDVNAGGVALASAEARAAEAELQTRSGRALAEISTLLRAARALTERARRVDEELIRPAELVRAAARASFREGATDILRLVDAERVYTDARREALELKLDAFASVAEARLAMGQEMMP